MGRLNDKVPIITGSTSGVGDATAGTFVKEGACVVVTGRSSARCDAVVESLGNERAIFVPVDVTDESQLKEWNHD
jgi:NADP-dependent 3-hydroxy acid dehydrogenase YdfG